MKRSEMVKFISFLLNENHPIDRSETDDVADFILEWLEDKGMLPPKIEGIYDSTPTVTPTGNLDYSWKRGWEPE